MTPEDDREAGDAADRTHPDGTPGRVAWAIYDWANNSFAAVVSTFVFPAYFARRIAADEASGTSQWGYTVGLAGVVVALSGPVLGAIADQGGRRKPWLGAFTLLTIGATAALWFATPGPDSWLMALVVAGLATVGAEAAFIFYNSMLPSLTTSERMGRWSGWAWGLGYAGGLSCLLLAWFGLVRDEAWFSLPHENAAHVRATFLLVAVWYGLFAVPLFVLTPDAPRAAKPLRTAVRDGLRQVARSVRRAREHAPLARFLVARMLYVDGLATVFAFGGVYAAGTFGMDEQRVLLFGIALNVSAGLGAATFAWIDDRVGSKATILISLTALCITGSALLLVESRIWFWVLGALLGLFVGPAQAAGRSYLGRAAPPGLRSQLFGLYAFSGKATTFLGPFLVGAVTAASGSQRLGMSVIVAFLALGLALMLTVPPPGDVRRRLAGLAGRGEAERGPFT